MRLCLHRASRRLRTGLCSRCRLLFRMPSKTAGPRIAYSRYRQPEVCQLVSSKRPCDLADVSLLQRASYPSSSKTLARAASNSPLSKSRIPTAAFPRVSSLRGAVEVSPREQKATSPATWPPSARFSTATTSRLRLGPIMTSIPIP